MWNIVRWFETQTWYSNSRGSLFEKGINKSVYSIYDYLYKNKSLKLFFSLRDVIFYFTFKLQELNLDGLITHELSFEEINKAFDLLAEGNSIRCVVWMDK